jgi:hypothetical protein
MGFNPGRDFQLVQDSKCQGSRGALGPVVVGFPGTIADALQLFFGPADQDKNKDLPIE